MPQTNAPTRIRRHLIQESPPHDDFADNDTISDDFADVDTDEDVVESAVAEVTAAVTTAPPVSEDEDEEEDDEDEDDDEVDEDEGDDDEELSDEDATTSGGHAAASLEGLKEIGNLASWTVSTAKPGNGVEQLRDEDTSLFWQSDGPQPHSINIHFAKRVKVKRMRMFLDFENDESYTPTKLSVLSGTGYQDLQEVTKLELERPSGWVEVGLEGVHEDGQLRTFLIQVCIHANHQNGKDTHVRGLQIFSLEPPTFEEGEIPFTSDHMLAELELR